MDRPLTEHIRQGEEPLNVTEYEKVGGYQALRKALSSMAPEEVTQVVTDSGLTGRGGAGFSTGRKWSFIPLDESAPHPKYMIANGDEMEPGAIKDHLLLRGHPHQLIEGMIIAAYAVQADRSFIFVRWAYKQAAERVARAIAEAYEQGYLGKNILGSGYSLEMHLHTSAGRYICGEATALLNALEGERGIPRHKPPHAAQAGMWSRPTVVNNIETLSNVSHIVDKGAEWFKGLSRTGTDGTRLYQVSGRVVRPGVWELPTGTTVREIIEEHAGGMREGFSLRGLVPGGASSPFLLAKHLDVQMDADSLEKVNSRLGTATIIVLDDKTCPVGLLANLIHFYARESCGWCTPCRDGLPWTAKVLDAIEEGQGQSVDIERLGIHARLIKEDATFCTLAIGAMFPLRSGLEYFRSDFERHIEEKGCPWR